VIGSVGVLVGSAAAVMFGACRRLVATFGVSMGLFGNLNVLKVCWLPSLML
jgi:exosortase/archaeosortase